MSRLRHFFVNVWNKAKKDPPFVFLHIGTATGLLGFCMTDPLPLRLCSITSSVASITFLKTRVPVVSMGPIYWSCCFIAVNSYKIYELLMERRSVVMTPEEEDIYVRHFMKSGMRPRQFKKLLDNAIRRKFDSGMVLHKQGSAAPTTVMLLTKGRVRIRTHDEDLFTVDASKPICFLGDTHVLEMADRAAHAAKNGLKDSTNASTSSTKSSTSNATSEVSQVPQGQATAAVPAVVVAAPVPSAAVIEHAGESLPTFSATAVAEADEGHQVEALEWENVYLVRRLLEGSETSHSLRAVLTHSMVQKLVDIGSHTALDKYTTLLFACAADGNINASEKKVLDDYAKAHGIDRVAHELALKSIGWTGEDYERGEKLNDSAPPIFSPKRWLNLRDRLRNLVYDKPTAAPA